MGQFCLPQGEPEGHLERTSSAENPHGLSEPWQSFLKSNATCFVRRSRRTSTSLRDALPAACRRPRPTLFTWEHRSLVFLLSLSLIAISSGIFAITGSARWTSFSSPASEQQPPTPVSYIATLPHPSLTAEESTRLTTPTQATLTAFPLTVRKVVIDPGHGGSDIGTVATRGLAEKDLTLDIAHRLRQILEESAVTVLMTREQDEALALDHRTATANRWEGDLFVSIHVNWLTPAHPARHRNILSRSHG